MNFKRLTDDELNKLNPTEFLAHQKENETRVQELRKKTAAPQTRDNDGNSLGIPNGVSRDDIRELTEREQYSYHLIQWKRSN